MQNPPARTIRAALRQPTFGWLPVLLAPAIPAGTQRQPYAASPISVSSPSRGNR